MPNRRHSSRLLLPGCRAKATNSSFRLMASLVSQGMMAFRRSWLAEKCPPCPRTPVNHVSGPYRSFKKGLAVRAKPIFQLDANAGYVRGGPVNVQCTFTVATRLYRCTVSPASRASPLPQHPLTWLPAQIIAPTLSGSGSVCVTGADTTRRIASCALNASTARSCAWLAMGSSR